MLTFETIRKFSSPRDFISSSLQFKSKNNRKKVSTTGTQIEQIQFTLRSLKLITLVRFSLFHPKALQPPQSTEKNDAPFFHKVNVFLRFLLELDEDKQSHRKVKRDTT